MSTQVIKFSISNTNTLGLTDYHIFSNVHSDFTGSAVPSGFPMTIVPLGAENIGSFVAYETGVYYFRVYSFNREADLYSTGYASGSVVIQDINVIRDLTISRLRVISSTGANLPTGSKVFSTFELNPGFNWEIGSQTNNALPTDYNIRATVRCPSETLFPIVPIYSEYIFPVSGNNLSGAAFTLDFEANKNLPNGPHRNYDFVVEAVDRYGNTSAGNTTTPQPLTEAGWASNPDGFDIVKVTNPIISGFYLTSGSAGVLTYNGTNYNTDQYFDINGNACIKFSGIDFPDDIIGGRVFASRSGFNRFDALTGKAGVTYADFQIDNQDSAIFAQTRLNTAGIKSGYMALMLFDSFDREYKKYQPSQFWTGLYISNTVGAMISGNISEFTVANFIQFYNNSGNNTLNTKLSVISTGNSTFRLSSFDSLGQEVIFATYKE